MIGDTLEIQRKNELQALLDKFKRNVDGVGSKKLLKEKYPTAYAHLMDEIMFACNAYTHSAIDHIQADITSEEAQLTWGNKSNELRNAITNYSSDEVQSIVRNFISELMMTFKDKVLVGYESEEEVLSA